ncbi:HAD family hydrolase [Leucobacter sp. USHLN154]|uniref:HAD family hydrolase n=1 Tax=Leucobacter sp. USHLN154 TaxID=3081269 RepID=UPI0030179901
MRASSGEGFEAVVFDCDGVLVDSERLMARIDQVVFRELGWEATIEEITARFLGKAGPEYEREIASVLGPVSANWRAPYEHLYENAMATELIAIEGVERALKEISLPKAVASNSRRGGVISSLDRTNLRRFFGSNIVGIDDVPSGKPAPDPYLEAARMLRVSPTYCAAVEDSPTGVVSARAAGMHVFGYAGGLSLASELKAVGAEVFLSMSELPQLLRR